MEFLRQWRQWQALKVCERVRGIGVGAEQASGRSDPAERGKESVEQGKEA